MNMNKVSTALAMLLLGFAGSAFRADDWLTAILLKIDEVRTNYPQEKIHLHFDKPFYSMGEDVWLKGYVVNSERNELSALSKIMYVDIVDERDSIRQTLTLPVVNGLANGDFKLNDSLFDAGTYRIKAYTRWMQNFGSENFFSKIVTIGDARRGTNLTTDADFKIVDSKLQASIVFKSLTDRLPLADKAVSWVLFAGNKVLSRGKTVTDEDGRLQVNTKIGNRPTDDLTLQTILIPAAGNTVKRNFAVANNIEKADMQFFPEGGRLVTGLRSKVAFKAVLPGGNGAQISGSIVDQNNQFISSFDSQHAGMGVFVLQPLAGATYTAVVKYSPERESRYTLPIADATGYVLSINHINNDSLNIKVATNIQTQGNSEIALVGQQNGVVYYSTKLNLRPATVSTNISSKRFATGIVQFTLIDIKGTPLAERLIFVDHDDQLHMTVAASKGFYGRHEKVELSFDLEDANKRPVEGNFSVAVTDVGKVADDVNGANNILSDLLLTSDLKGRVQDPGYYFNTANAERNKYLDYLMLTQGWRRFKIADLLSGNTPPIKYQPQQSIEVTGRITSLSGKPVSKAKVSLYGNPVGGMILADTVADENGYFAFSSLNFNGDTRFVVRAKNAKDRDNVKIVLDRVTTPIFKPEDLREGYVNSTLLTYLQATQKRFEMFRDGIPGKSIMLKQVDIRSTKIKENRTVRGSSKLGSGEADIVISKEKLLNYQILPQAFYGLAGIDVKPNGLIYRVGRVVSLTSPNGRPMAVYLDGVPVDPSLLKQIPPSSVEGIEIFKSLGSTAIYGNDGYWGVIQITTRNGSPDVYVGPNSYLDKILVKGYSVQREFYSPVYDESQQPADDQRSTVYWNPNVVTNVAGKAKITFYTTDDAGKHMLIAEGIDLYGRLVHKTFSYEVK